MCSFPLEFVNFFQTHTRNTDSYSETDSGKLDINLSNQQLSLILIKVSQRVANKQIIDKKTSLQKFVILQHNDNLSETSKISQPIISESRDQCPRYPGTFIYTLLALARV